MQGSALLIVALSHPSGHSLNAPYQRPLSHKTYGGFPLILFYM